MNTPLSSPSILLIGCGKMGGALLRGWIRQKAVRVIVVDPAPQPRDLKAAKKITWLNSPDKINPAFRPDAIVLAIKPQMMAATLPAFARYKNSVFLSIAAGQTLGRLSEMLDGGNRAIVRAMPNLPASVGAGMSVAVANSHVTANQRVLCDTLLRAAGDVAWVKKEALIDPVTAVSGSGPAYVFALVEAMAAAGEKLGLSPKLSMQLARQTIIGSGALLAQSPESAKALRQAVTSPGGTTEATLKILLAKKGLFDLMLRAMQAAAKRAAALAK
jgi:pyrroline-5-carboxylate reductase